MIGLDFKNIGIPTGILRQTCGSAEAKLKKVFGYAFAGLPDDRKLIREIQAFARRQKKNGWKELVVLGIGGSALGLRAIAEALLSSFDTGMHLHVVDNIDPVVVGELFRHLDWKRTLFIVISKSGTTVEPMAMLALARERLQKKFPKDWQKHLAFVTDPNQGLLREIADQEGIATFDVPERVGGRFSVLSAVGLLPAALAGVNILGLMEGARAMREEIRKSKGLQNPALALAAAQFLLDRKQGKSMTVMMPYSNALFRFSDWYRQLLAESLGKNSKTGPTPIQALGTTDQHSQLQLYQEGPNNKWFIFLKVLRPVADLRLGKNAFPGEMKFLNGKTMGEILNAAHAGTTQSLARAGRPNVTVEMQEVTANRLGALFMLFEIQVALLGLFYRVNAFDQPGVEASKNITRKILAS